MPELCEVQIMSEHLHQWSAGKILSSMDIVDSKFQHLPIDHVQGRTIHRTWRRAKYTVQEVGEVAIILHFRMTGKVVLGTKDNTKFVRLQWNLHDGTTIVFADMRRFATVDIVDKNDIDAYFQRQKLGEEIWPMVRDGLWWQSTLGKCSGTIKQTLLRQDIIVGIGNILASELLYRAKISPMQATRTLSVEQWKRLAESCPVLIENILTEERSGIGFLHEGSDNPTSFWVYNREGEKCRYCASFIQRTTQQARSTYYCPHCQST